MIARLTRNVACRLGVRRIASDSGLDSSPAMKTKLLLD